MSPVCDDLENEKVSSLMVEAGNIWDLDILRDLFDERDRNIIERIPLSNISRDDCWQWTVEKKGIYSIKSAYKMLVSNSTRAYEDTMTNGWNIIWKLQVPLKVRHLIWRACISCLPTKFALRSRKVELT